MRELPRPCCAGSIWAEFGFSDPVGRVEGGTISAFRGPTGMAPPGVVCLLEQPENAVAEVPSTMLALGTDAPDFSLPEPATGSTVSLSDFRESRALLVMFLSNHCPFVKHLADELASFAEECQGRGVAVVGINANDVDNYPADSPEKMADEVRARGYTFPYLFDESQEVAKAYQAACTPDFFLFDGDGKLAYRGQFDSSRPSLDVPITGSDLRTAIDAVLAGVAPSQLQTPSVGCNIKWKAGNEPAWFG